MDNNLQLLFDMIVTVFQYARINNPALDGKSLWQPIKQLVDDNKLTIQYKKIDSDLIDKIMALPEYDNNNKIIESNHFIIQQIRIPTEYVSIRKILQIALNIGQWLGKPNKQFKDEINYSIIGMESLSFYLEDHDIELLSEQISDNLFNKIVECLVCV